jgi:hypothetical protein
MKAQGNTKFPVHEALADLAKVLTSIGSCGIGCEILTIKWYCAVSE